MERFTQNPIPSSVEKLSFTDAEGAISALAVESLVFYSLQAERTDPLPTEQPAAIADRLRRISEFSGSFADLTIKLNGDQPTELTPNEIAQLGQALYYYGFHTVGRARELLGKDASSMTEADYRARASYVRQTANDTFTLFKELEPIALSKKLDWNNWPEPAQTADPSLKPARRPRRRLP